MLKLLFYTGLRVSELVNIKISDIDIKNNKIFINQGKGAKGDSERIYFTLRRTLHNNHRTK